MLFYFCLGYEILCLFSSAYVRRLLATFNGWYYLILSFFFFFENFDLVFLEFRYLIDKCCFAVTKCQELLNRVWSILCLSHLVGFVYSKSLQIPEHIKIPIDRIGCNCSGDCSTSEHCLCAKLNGSELPYVSTKRKNVNRNDSKHSRVGR
jgi:hypothetical protein